MSLLLLLLLLIPAAFAIGFAVGRATDPGSATRDSPANPPPATPALDDEGFAAQLLLELAAGRKIEAIKLYRERTGVGLKEAKDAVEALERGDAAPPRSDDAHPAHWDHL